MGVESNSNESKHVHAENASNCSICFDPLVYKDDDRTNVKLRCNHQFHLDCIGSAFNAKKMMKCPLCRNVEQGRWLYAEGLPNQYVNDQDRIPEPHLGFSTHLAFGMELCPFEAFGQHNPFVPPNMLVPNIYNHGLAPHGSQLCPHIEYNVTFPPSQYVVSHRSYPSHLLIPLASSPTNPRLFLSILEPGVIIARYYYTHPIFDQGAGSLMVNVPAAPPYLGGSLVNNAPMANIPTIPPYIGSNLVTNTLVTNAPFANVPIAQPYLGSILWANDVAVANTSMAQTNLNGNLVTNAPVANTPVTNVDVANTSMDLPHLNGNLVANAPVANAPVFNVPIAQPYLGSTLGTNDAVGNASVASHYIGGNLVINAPMANVPIAQHYLGNNLWTNDVPSYPGGSSVANAPVANNPIAQPYLGSNLWATGAIANASMALIPPPYLGGNLVANSLVPPPYLGDNVMPNNWVPQLPVGDLTSVSSGMGSLPAPVLHGHVFPNGQEQLDRGVLDSTQQHHMERNLSGLAAINFTEGGGSGNDVGGGGESSNSVGGGSGGSDGNRGNGSNGVDESRTGLDVRWW